MYEEAKRIKERHEEKKKIQRQQCIQNSQMRKLSGKTYELAMKKIEKELENEIRLTDTENRGMLSYYELGKLLMNLRIFKTEYLLDQNPRNSRKHLFSPRSNSKIYKKLDEEVLFHRQFWKIFNPLNEGFINNEILYDILIVLLCTTDVPLSLPTQMLTGNESVWTNLESCFRI